MVLISIIVPVYNTSRYLGEALTSICEQTFQNLEIICVNDGSTDNSAEILQKFAIKDQRIKLINQSNQGLGAARNAGIEIATGKYIGFIDSDDTIDVDFYQKLFEVAEENSADISYAPFKYIFPDKIFDEEVRKGTYVSLAEKYNILNNGGVTNKLFRRSLIKSIRFPIGKVYEDNLFLVKAVTEASKISIIDDVHYNYLIKENSLTTDKSNKEKRNADSLSIAEEIFAYAFSKKLSKSEKSELIDFVVRSFIYIDRLQNKQYVKKFSALLQNDKETAKIFNQIILYNRLTFLDKIFSVKKYRYTRIIHIFGLKIKQKLKKD